MIDIICDQYGLYKLKDSDRLVVEEDQFETELEIIHSRAKSGNSLCVVVRNPLLFRYFDAAIKYGAQKRIVDPVKILAEELQQTVVPQYLKNQPNWVVDLNLIEKAKKQLSKGESIERWLKRTLLGDVWSKDLPRSQSELSSLFEFLISHDEHDLHILTVQLLKEQLQKWSGMNQDYADLLTWLCHAPFKRSKFIIWEQLLSLFPQDKVADWLQQDNIWFELSQLPSRIKLPAITTSLQVPENIAAFARDFLKEQWMTSQDLAIQFISGKLDFEKNFLLEQLHYQLHTENPLMLSTYKALLALELPEITSVAKQLVPTKKPSIISAEDPVSDVQTWLENEYLPFYNSCSILGKVKETELYLVNFEEWLAKHYQKMLFDGEGMAYRQIAELKKISNTDPVLMVVFDGLDYLCACEELLPLMRANDLFPVEEPKPYFSFLPSQTEIAKPVLVAGKTNEQIPEEGSSAAFYKELLKDCIGVSENDIRSKTDKDGSLLELIQEPAKVYLYLDNQLDREYLHSSLRQYLRKRKYKEYVLKKAEEIVHCVRDFKDMYGKYLKVVICSDHGYTVIPKSAEIIKEPVNGKMRTRTLHKHTSEDLVKLDLQCVWQLTPALFGLSEEMVLPKGYTCFKSRPLGATHGGCSPQEMAVPWFVFSNERPVSAKSLSFSLEGEIFRKRSVNQLVLHISNPNKYQIKLVDLDVSGADISTSLPVLISSTSAQKVNASVDASNVGDGNVQFVIRYRLKSITGELEESIEITKPTKGSMSTEFDDDFDI